MRECKGTDSLLDYKLTLSSHPLVLKKQMTAIWFSSWVKEALGNHKLMDHIRGPG